MRTAFLPIVFFLVSACDLPPPTPQEEANIQEQQDEFELNNSCFDGDQKACDDLDRLREVQAVGDIVEGANAN